MKRKRNAASVQAALLMTTSFPALGADSFSEAFAEGTFGYSFRWRLENADQDPFPRDATALPLRARINFHTADLNRFSFKVEFDYIFNFGVDTFNAGYESLGGDSTSPGQAFRTPLATLHAFNGWADKFLTTPDAGLRDAFFGIKGNAGKWKWNVLYHDFSAKSGNADFGTEFDGSIKRKFKDNFGILFKAASFSSDSPAYGDTTKFWVQLTADY